MAKHPKVRLSRLRAIGWQHWDPIGLRGEFSDWQNSPVADEYDGYLLTVAAMVRSGEGDDAAVQFLVDAESERMGMGVSADTQARAVATIAAIRADKQLWGDG